MTPADPAPPDADRDEIVAGCLEDLHRRRALGERPMAEDYAQRAGAAYQDFLAVLAAEQAIDDVIEPVAQGLFPRPFGDYTLLRELGRGAVGVVFEAMHRRLGRKVALKVLRTGFDDDAKAVERFRREARALAQVKHDHIVDVYEAGDVDGRPFYAMELLDGVSLWQMARDKRLPQMRALFDGLSDVADALRALHDAGIVHRDVKPSNIMVRTDGRMLLADFGLARTATSEALTQTGHMLGTPLYMSPEQVLGKRDSVDGRSDVYSLGATLYELVGGRPPCKGPDVAATLRKILSERPKPLSALVPGLPGDVERVVMKAIEKEPRDRYQTAAALRDDLRAFASGGAVTGRPVSAVAHRLRGARRFLWPAVGALAAAAALVVWLALRPPTPARLEVTSHPAATVLVDGVAIGSSPLVRQIPPGRHEITVRLPGFDDATTEVALEPGQLYSREIDLIVCAATQDPQAIEKLAAELDVPMQAIEHKAAASAANAGAGGVVAVFPRGKVRIEDLDTLRIDGGDAIGKGALRFVVDGGRTVQVDVSPAGPVTEIPFPGEVKRTLAPGATVSWGWHSESGEFPHATFHVVPTPAGPKIREMESRLSRQAPAIRHGLRTQFFLGRELHMAAFREAETAARDAPHDQRPIDMMRRALTDMGLEGTSPWAETQRALAALPGR